ncbi:MAG: ATP-binding protein [bacterium]
MTLKPEKQLFLHILGSYLLSAIFPVVVVFLFSLLHLPRSTIFLSTFIIAVITAFFFTWRMFSEFRTTVGELEYIGKRLDSELPSSQVAPARLKIVVRLFDSLSRTASRLHQNITELKQKEIWLHGILDTMQEGVFILDQQGKIIITNKKLRQLLGSTILTGKFYWEVIREPRLAKMLQQLDFENSPCCAKIELNSKTFLCTATYYPDCAQRIVTFNDITEIVTAEKIKRDFVTNVSHELKTPLTAIKGYVETLEETADKTNAAYLEIVRRHTERLIGLVQNLSNLSYLENPDTELHRNDINLNELATDVLAIFEHAAKNKGLKLSRQLPETPTVVTGDAMLIEQALINLVDNAIKYTETGSVMLTVQSLSERVAISVQDTGIGVPPEHIPRIFERFYVVDRSRSRQTGGTGLGLAIVRHIVELHQGEVKVESTLGKGSKFTIYLPGK